MESEKAIDSLRRLVRALRVTSHRAWNEVGISGAQLYVLQVLGDGRPRSLGEIAAATHTDPSSVSVVAARLVERGLVEKRKAAEDARRAQLSLSKAGEALLAKAPEPLQAKLIAAIEGLSTRERTQLTRTLARLVDELGLGEGPAAMFFEEESGATTTSRRRGRAS